MRMKIKSEIERLYYKEKWDVQRIADHFGCQVENIMEILSMEAIVNNELH